MDNNPYNFKIGDKVQLDAGFANTSEVKIMSMTPAKLYSTVALANIEKPTVDDCWSVMTDRLTPLKVKESHIL